MGMRSQGIAGALLGLVLCAPLPAQEIHANEIFIPWNKAGSRGLNALLVYADVPGNRPLVVLTHGTSRKHEERHEVTAWSMLPQANWFARRGWTVRKHHGHKLPALVGLQRAEVLRWKHELHPACDGG